MLSRQEAADVTSRILPGFDTEHNRLERVDKYLHGTHDKPYQPATPNNEYRLLVGRSVSNWLPLIVDAPAQALFVEGYRSAEDPENARPWSAWQANRLDARQSAVHRAAIGYGCAYVTVLPGDTAPVIKGVSARKMLAVYADPAEDEWPIYALRVETVKTSEGVKRTIRLYDDEAIYHLEADTTGGNPTFLDSFEHGLGVCPVVRFADDLDLEGRSFGQVEPLIPIQDRINQTAFDLLLAQTYGAFKVRTISGMSLPAETEADDDATTAEIAALRRQRQAELAVNRFLVAEDETTKFGQLDETPLDGFIKSLDTSVRHLAAISQTPPHHLLGQMANLSADALAAAEASLMRKVDERKHSFGESWEQVLRLAALADGDQEAADDFSAQVRWKDAESRSLAQTADALGKIATMLGVPVQMLWEKIPGWTTQDQERAESLVKEADAFGRLGDVLNQQTQQQQPPPAA